MTKTTTTTTATARIDTYSVGENFGCESRLRIGRKTIWTSDTYPRGCSDRAREAAEEEAARRGLRVS